MATTVTYTGRNVVGNRKEDYIRVTLDGETTQNVATRMRWIDNIEVETIALQDQQLEVWPNSTTASAAQSDPGRFYIEQGTDGATHVFRVTGK